MSGLEEGLISGLLVTSIGIGIAAYINGEKLRKRLNYTQEVLIKKGLVKEFDLTLALRGIKMHDED
jgi:hypothetical protein